ncbi:MAG TPA: DUF5689 domain-containing protein [Bacteroidia bacterium]|mgnify:CR=1 FL=1|nr:DUF5689 domain-containing protein [Bacteroidia bacterium]
MAVITLNKYFILSSLLLLLTLVFNACKKEFDLPPLRQANDGTRINIAGIQSRYNSNSVYRFRGDTNLYCVVTADEVSGNLYKDIYVKDHSGGLHIKLVAPGGLFIGDSIRINLNGIILNNYSELIQLDSVDISKSVVKLASGLQPQPELTSIPQLISNSSGYTMQSRLIKLNNVEFMQAHRGVPYANALTRTAGQYTLQDCENNQVTIRTSGFCYFANQLTPKENGSVIAIASRYNNSVQLILRSSADVNMTGVNCTIVTPTAITSTTFLFKDFEDGNVTSGDWISVNAIGSINWAIKTLTNTASVTKVAEGNNYISSGNQPACETWLISPPIDLSASTAPNFSFTSASLFSGPPLQTLISTNYVAGAPATATWTVLYPTYGLTGNHTSSGAIHLAYYKKQNVRVAFKYTGNNGAGQRWQLDNIRIWE